MRHRCSHCMRLCASCDVITLKSRKSRSPNYISPLPLKSNLLTMKVVEHPTLWFLLSTVFLTLQHHFVICCRPSRLKVSFPLQSRLPSPCCIVQAGFLQAAGPDTWFVSAGYHAVAPYLPGYFPSSPASDDNYSLVPERSPFFAPGMYLTFDYPGCSISLHRAVSCSPRPRRCCHYRVRRFSTVIHLRAER